MNTENTKITQETLEALLYLSRLSSEYTNVETLKSQVDQVVSYFDLLSEYDEGGDPYDAYPTTEVSKLREDEVVKGVDIPDVKKMTPEFMDGYFRVPKVVEL